MKKLVVPSFVWVALGVVLLMALIAGLGRAAAPDSDTLSGRGLVAARQLIQNALQRSEQADQDTSNLQKLQDVHFGIAYVNSARLLCGSDASLEKATHVKVGELFTTLRAQHRMAIDSLGGHGLDRFGVAA